MTKGLHKDSLRKVDNPHQWMIDDARMELIQQIKAEVERLKKEQPARNAIGAICGEETVVDASKLLSVLDTLQEQPVDLDDAINNWQGIEAFPEGCGITPLPKAMEIVDKTARHFYELGRQSKQTEWTEEDIKNGSYISAFLQANCGDSVILKRATIWFMSRLKQLPIQQNKPKVCEDVEEAAKAYADDINSNECLYTYTDFTDAFIAGAKWQKEQMMIQWTGNNLKDVIEFTGKSPRFNEWFKSWDDYEDYVRQHGNIFKMFNDDGSHLEVPVGAWIVKTPDKRCVASKFTLKQPESEKIAGAYQLGLADKEKMLMKEAVEGRVVDAGIFATYNTPVEYTHSGDKVKIIIVKGD